MISRNLSQKFLEALTDTPVILVNGPRQCGKSTLVKWILKENHPAVYYTLDNLETLASLKADPTSFIQQSQTSIVIDEIQKAPEYFSVIKEAVDKDRTPGRYILTGSANVLLLPKLSESLAGRMEIITLWPLSQGEIANIHEDFVSQLFAEKFKPSEANALTKALLFDKILLGGYPEVLTRKNEERRRAWFQSYITTLLQRDIRDIADIEGLTLFPRLLSLIAARSGSLLNTAELSRSSGITQTTLQRYLTILQTVFLVHLSLPWSSNISKRFVKSPKIFITDTGLLAYLLGIESNRLKQEPHMAGLLLENFVVMELKKQLTWSKTFANLFHYRSHTGDEIDIILENLAGQCVGIEIKAASTVTENDFKHLKLLSQELKSKFVRGIVLYTGDKILPFGKELYAIPVACLWS